VASNPNEWLKRRNHSVTDAPQDPFGGGKQLIVTPSAHIHSHTRNTTNLDLDLAERKAIAELVITNYFALKKSRRVED